MSANGRTVEIGRDTPHRCTLPSLSQDVGMALGAQAGEGRIDDVVLAGGFTRLWRVAETLFNPMLEARL